MKRNGQRKQINRRYIIPLLKEKAQVDRQCPGGGVESGHIQQNREPAVVETRLGQVEKLGMQGGRCGKTWTCQPEGMNAHGQRSLRVMALNVLWYALGLSSQAEAAVLTRWGAPESGTTV